MPYNVKRYVSAYDSPSLSLSAQKGQTMPYTLKRNLAILFGSVLLLAILFVGGSWAFHEVTKERPNWHSGKVIDRQFYPAHEETRFRQQYAGQDCYSIYNSVSKSYTRTCNDRYITVPYTVHISDDWNIRIENCNVAKKDGTIWSHKDGTPKCFKKWIDVSQDNYNQFKIGTEWEGR